MDDPGPDGAVIIILILICIILLNAFFTVSESALSMLSDGRLPLPDDQEAKKAKKIRKLTKNHSKLTNAAQTGLTLAGSFAAAVASLSFAGPAAGWLKSVLKAPDGSGGAVYWLSAALMTLAVSFVMLVLGTLVPRRLALKNPEKAACAVSSAMLFFKGLLSPFTAAARFTADLILRLFGVDPDSDPAPVTEHEIRMLVDAGEENGVIEESQKEMINNIFEFDDMVASEVMTHRTDMVAVDLNSTFDDVVRLAIDEGCSRIPAYDSDIDDIKGIIYVKDLLRYVGHDLPEGGLNQIMRRAYFVPESKKCGELFTEMTEKRIQMCIVSDEYGGTAGLVTIEDLIESIVGNIQDEYDDEDEDNIERIDDSTYTVDGTAAVDEVADLIGASLPEGDYDTVGGLIMSMIGRIPGEGEDISVTVGGCVLSVDRVSDRRIERIKIKKLPESTAE